MRHLVVLGALAVLCPALVACTSHEPRPGEPAKAGAKDPVVEPEPEPDPEPEVPAARVVIASVQMIEDCPEEKDAWRPPPAEPAAAMPPAADEEAPAQAARSSMVAPGAMAEPLGDVAAGDSPHGWRQPCTQSTMQVVLTSQADEPSAVEIQAITLIDPKSGKELARLTAREPAAWRDGSYQSWDQTLRPREEVKTSYALSVPQWSEVEKVLATGNSHASTFTLELEVKVGDRVQTVRSPEFVREVPHVVVT